MLLFGLYSYAVIQCQNRHLSLHRILIRARPYSHVNLNINCNLSPGISVPLAETRQHFLISHRNDALSAYRSRRDLEIIHIRQASWAVNVQIVADPATVSSPTVTRIIFFSRCATSAPPRNRKIRRRGSIDLRIIQSYWHGQPRKRHQPRGGIAHACRSTQNHL